MPGTSRISPRSASAARWARSAPATITSKCRSSTGSRCQAAHAYGLAKGRSWCRSTADRAASVTRSAPITSYPGQGGERLGVHCRTVSSRVRRSTRRRGEQYLGAMNAAINIALANRQILAHLTREARSARCPKRASRRCSTFPTTPASSSGRPWTARRRLYVHRKGATRAFGPGHPAIRRRYREVGSASHHRRQHGHGLVGTRPGRRRARNRACPRRAMAPAAR